MADLLALQMVVETAEQMAGCSDTESAEPTVARKVGLMASATVELTVQMMEYHWVVMKGHMLVGR